VNDEYKTIKTIGEGYYTEKRSKFLAFAHHIDNTEEAKAIVAEYRKKYFNARHVCYAYMIGADGATFRANDDGEPSGSAGKPILGQITSHETTNVIVVVVRYYGGVNLGTGGLATAYKTAAAEALENAESEMRLVEETVTFSFPYPMMNSVMRVVKELGPRIVDQKYDNTCEIQLSIRKSEAQRLRDKLAKLSFE
jgi:uncharacterized YigZ family protein